MIDCVVSALIGYGKSLSLRQRLCRGFSMLECFSHVLLCASYVLTLLLTQELRLRDPWLVLYRSLPRKATRPSYITIASHLSHAYLLEWSAPPSLSRSVLVSRVTLVLPALPCCCTRLVVCPVLLLLPSGPFNDTQNDRPPHPHLRPLRLCRPQLKAPSTKIPDSAYRCYFLWLR
jgi:hypothetical protein